MKRMHPRDRCARIVRECRQVIIDVEWWNNNRHDAPPMDCEFERVLLPVARACLSAWDSADDDAVTVATERMNEICKSEVRGRGTP